MSSNIINIGPSETANSHPLGSLGDLLKQIGGYTSNYDFIAGLFPELLPTLPFLDTAFKGLGSYINAIEDHKLDFLLPVLKRREPLPPSLRQGSGIGGIRPSTRITPSTSAPQVQAGLAVVSADAPANIQLANR